MWREVTTNDDEPHRLDARRAVRKAFAILDRRELVSLARAMPDAQSAILLCLAWQAAYQSKMKLGPLAGLAVARLSGADLSEMTNRPIKTVRHAIRRLKEAAIVHSEPNAPGKKTTYRLNLPTSPVEGIQDHPQEL